MGLTYCGTATIDDKLYLRKSDEAFFDLAGQNIYGSVADLICEEDLPLFQTAVRELFEKRVSQNIVAVKKQGEGTEKKWLLVEMNEEPFQLDGSLLVRLGFYSFKPENAKRRGEVQGKSAYEMFFELTAGMMLTYDKENDSLEIAEGMEGQAVSLFRGTLEKWKNEMFGKIADESKNAFEGFCDDMASGRTDQFGCELTTSAFSVDGTMGTYQFKCCSYENEDGELAIMGCIKALGSTGNVTAGYVMDAGLPVLNKRSIVEYAQNAFLKNQDTTYLVVMDIDDFKTVNDTYGHLFGDEVLVRVSKIIKDAIGKSGMLGRIGGDEFMIVLNWVESQIELRNVLRSIRTGVEWAFKGEKDNIRITCSLGVAAYPTHGDSYDKIFQLADRMLYTAKSKGKNRYVLYTPEIHDASNVATEKSPKNRGKDALREDKIGVMLRLVEEFMVRKIVTYEAEFRELVACFELDRITMAYSNMAEAITLEDDVFTNVVDEKIYTQPEEGFVNGFDKNNVLVMNGRFNLEAQAPELCRKLEADGIESALFYKMVKSGKMFGYVMFAKKSRRQQWSEYEKTLLACVGKALELSFTGK